MMNSSNVWGIKAIRTKLYLIIPWLSPVLQELIASSFLQTSGWLKFLENFIHYSLSFHIPLPFGLHPTLQVCSSIFISYNFFYFINNLHGFGDKNWMSPLQV